VSVPSSLSGVKPASSDRRTFGPDPWAVLAAVLWGTVYPGTQVALHSLSPYGLAWWRALLGLAFMVAVSLAGGSRISLRHLRLDHWLRLFVLSLLSITGFQVLLNLAVQNAGTVLTAFVISTYPPLTVLLSPLLLGERIPPRRAAGALVSVAGAFLLVGVTTAAQTAPPHTLTGAFLGFGSSVCFAFYLLLTRRWTFRYQLDARTIALFSPMFSAPVLLALALATSPSQLLAFQPETLIATLWLGVLATGVAYLALNHSLRRREASQATIALLLVPVVATVLSIVLFGARLTPVQIVGAAVCLAGMVAASI
jgi:drug/metabolite transporter (DMT)-like permease